MRRFALILLGLVSCLLFAADGTACAPRSVQQPVIALDHASTEQWLCEQTYNSNLNLPRTCGEVAAPQGNTVVSQRGSHPDFMRAALRLAADSRLNRLQREIVAYNPNLSAGLRAVDYYVYLLRRLII